MSQPQEAVSQAPPQAANDRKSFNLLQMEKELESYHNMLKEGNLASAPFIQQQQQQQPAQQQVAAPPRYNTNRGASINTSNASYTSAAPENSFQQQYSQQQQQRYHSVNDSTNSYATQAQQRPSSAHSQQSNSYAAPRASYASTPQPQNYHQHRRAPSQQERRPQSASRAQQRVSHPPQFVPMNQQHPHSFQYQQPPPQQQYHQNYVSVDQNSSIASSVSSSAMMQQQAPHNMYNSAMSQQQGMPPQSFQQAPPQQYQYANTSHQNQYAAPQDSYLDDAASAADDLSPVEADASISTTTSSQLPGRKNRHKVEHVRQRIQEKMQQECTFKPKINRKFKSTKNRTSGKDRLTLLSKPKDRSNLENRKKELEESELKECTFQPNVKRVKKKKVTSSTSLNSSNPQELVDRLTYSHDDRQAQREMQKRMREMELIQKYKFRPSIRKESKQLIDEGNYRPVHERVGELQRQKHEMLQGLRMKNEQEKQGEYTFAPQVSERSEEIARSKMGNMSFHERFVQPQFGEGSLNREERARRKRYQESIEEKENYSFKPKLNRNSKKILEGRALYGKHTDFLKRQEILTLKQQQQQNMLQRQLNRKHQFKPKVSQTSKFLMETKPEMANETPEDRIERLTYRDKQRMDALREMIEEKHYGKYHFKPNINPLSKQMARKTNLEDMATNEHNQRVKEVAKHRHLKEESKRCTFRPKLMNPDLTQKLAQNSKYRNTEEMMHEKEQRIEEFRRMQQYKELKDCTFQPQINKADRKESGPVLINGLGRHLQRVERAKQQKEEQERREQEAFKVKVQDYQRQLPYTIPEPFNLKHDAVTSEANRRKTRAKWQKHEMSNCTFKPQTNTSLVDFVMEGI